MEVSALRRASFGGSGDEGVDLDVNILHIGKELETIRQAEKGGGNITKKQKNFIRGNGVTLNRKLSDAFTFLCRVRSVEEWICKTLHLDPFQEFPNSVLWGGIAISPPVPPKNGEGIEVHGEDSEEEKQRLREDVLTVLCPGQTNRKPSAIIESFRNWLSDGTILCRLLNAIRYNAAEGHLQRVKSGKSRDNIERFLDGLSRQNILRRGQQLFSPSDIMENKGITRVINCLCTLAEELKKRGKGEGILKWNPAVQEMHLQKEEIKRVATQLEAEAYKKGGSADSSTDNSRDNSPEKKRETSGQNDPEREEKERGGGEERMKAPETEKRDEESPRTPSMVSEPSSPGMGSPGVEETMRSEDVTRKISGAKNWMTASLPAHFDASNMMTAEEMKREEEKEEEAKRKGSTGRARSATTAEIFTPETDTRRREEEERINGHVAEREMAFEIFGGMDAIEQMKSLMGKKRTESSQKRGERGEKTDTYGSRSVSMRNRSATMVDAPATKPKLSKSPSTSVVNYADKKSLRTKKRWNADEIISGLFLGKASSDINELIRHNISHILCLSGGVATFPDGFKYMIYDIFDSQEQDIISLFPTTDEFITEALNTGSILVHCQKGVSRSSTVVMAYLMKLKDIGFNEAADFVISKRPIVCPNIGFMRQLQLYEDMKCQLEGTTVPHKRYRRLRLKSLFALSRVNRVNVKKPSDIRMMYVGDEREDEVTNLTREEKKDVHCKGCGEFLFNWVHVLEHNEPESPSNCTRVDVMPSSWMGDIREERGKISCCRCDQEVGSWNWNGEACSCSFQRKPSFVVSLPLLDIKQAL
ncbi:putative dual specificity phosphatase, catalytic domain protein [Planoprotostelium fungivorum]|uniref:protein-tyrosine-phosphatase n=1 Tax=Planoprotostelium fungivorum TaxID=1890364 RepID=A0A2P6NHR6_9EUKA|nr:putative dual specificity phosphatase, catalytic domain protein [Planoprotostelium fungivorum]